MSGQIDAIFESMMQKIIMCDCFSEEDIRNIMAESKQEMMNVMHAHQRQKIDRFALIMHNMKSLPVK